MQLSLEANRTEASELEGKILGYNALIESKKGDILRKREEFDIQNADTRKTLKEILKKQEETLQKQEEQTENKAEKEYLRERMLDLTHALGDEVGSNK